MRDTIVRYTNAMSDEPLKKDFTLLTDLPLVDPPAPTPDDAPPTENSPTPEAPAQFSETAAPVDDSAGLNLDFSPIGEEPASIALPPSPTEFAIAAPPETSAPEQSFTPPPPDRTVAADPVELSSQDAWNLSITGFLRPEQRARLTTLVTREPIGIREVDLEPQFEAGRVFIPRISEYLGISLVQAMRDASVQMSFEPAANALEQETASAFGAPAAATLHTSQSEHAFSFDQVLLTADSALPGISSSQITLVDLILVSATLTHAEVEARLDSLNAHVFEDRVESLKREIKARAHYRGAHAIIDFKLELQPLKDPALYKLILSGTAVKLNARSGADQGLDLS